MYMRHGNKISPWSLSVPDRPQYLRLRSGVWVCLSITAAMNLVLLTGSEESTQFNIGRSRFSAVKQSNHCDHCIQIFQRWKCLFIAYQTALTDSSVFVAVFIPLVSFVIQVRHPDWHFWSKTKVRRAERKTESRRNKKYYPKMLFNQKDFLYPHNRNTNTKFNQKL